MRDHGGNLGWAKAHFGGSDWIDLSTGINRVPYQVPKLSVEAFTALPSAEAMAHLMRAAARQFPEGDVQHWWSPSAGKAIGTRVCDELSWLDYAAAQYVAVNG